MVVRKFDPRNVNLKLVERSSQAAEMLEWVGQNHQLMALDVETGGLNWYDDKLRLVQFGSDTEGWSIPFERFPGLVREALEILDDRMTPLVGHNFKFDLHFIERNTGWSLDQTDWNRVHDTSLLAAVINSAGSKSLKDLARHYVSKLADAGQKELSEAMKRGGWNWETVPVDLPVYWIYGALDTVLTCNLFWALRRKSKENETYEAYELERAAMPVLYAIERKGMLVDTDHCERERDKLWQRCSEIESEVIGFGVSNIRSNDQLARAMLDAGVELVAQTDKGKWKMDKDALDELVHRTGHPLPTLVKEYRGGLKMANSYYENFIKFQRGDDRVHPFFRQVQARTGRMSATEPAIQTLPRPGTNPEVRNSFVAEQGYKLISTDFANVEARVFAHYAREHGMIEAIKSGVDLHCYTAQQIYNLPELPSKSDPKRQVAKNALFCTIYGGGAEKVAWTASQGGFHITLEEAQRALGGLFGAFPGIKGFQREMSNLASENLRDFGVAFIRLPDGRILSLQEGDDRLYAFTNWLIQGYSASLMKQRMIVADKMGLRDSLICVIHDELVAEVPDEDVEEFQHMIKEAMEDYYTLSVPIVAEPSPGGDRLGDIK